MFEAFKAKRIFRSYRSKWIREGLDVQPGQDESAIRECFGKFGITPNKDLIALYKTMDGKECMDEEMFMLWPLQMINDENSTDQEIKRTLKYGAMFADFSIHCWCYRINKEGEVLIDLYDDEEPEIRSSSVVEFFSLMSTDAEAALY